MPEEDEKTAPSSQAELPTAIVSEQPDPSGSESDDVDHVPEKVAVSRNEQDPTKASGVEEKKKEESGSMRDFARIFSYADGLDRSLYITATVGMIGSGASLPLMTLVFGGFTSKFNDFAAGKSAPAAFRKDVDHFVLYFVYLFVGRFVVVYVANVCITVAAIRTTRAIRKDFLERTLRLHVWHWDQEDLGSISSQVTTNGNRINQGIAEKLANVVQGVSLFFSGFIVALAVQWKLALIVMSIVPAIILVVVICVGLDAKIEAEITGIYSRAAVVAQDAISSIKTVHAFWAHDKIGKKYQTYMDEAHRLAWKKNPLYAILFSFEYFCVLAGTALAFWEGFRMYQSGEIPNVGTLLTVVLSVTIGATAMSMIAPQFQAITNAASAAAELFAVIDKQSLLDPLSPEGAKPVKMQGHIEIRDLCFAYPSRPSAQVLHNLNLTIPAGKTTALVGASGCGKSTLVGLLERWYEPASGSILIDGTDISEYNIKYLRSHVRLVQQEPTLFRGTVYENVAKGLLEEQRKLPHEKQVALIEEACKSSNAHDFIMQLPEGYETQVGERASMMSGGQRQRVAIARSIVSNPRILLLDEATSALDPRAEGIVQDALNRVSKDKTTLIIAHKLATVKAADNIVVMSHGRVLEEGTHRELLARDGQYAALVRAQDLGKAEKADADFNDEKADAELERRITLQRTQTGTTTAATDIEAQKNTDGTVNYTLLKCIYLMFKEHPDLYKWFALSGFSCLIGGGTYPAQALLFSRLIRVFTLPAHEAKQQADFFALMFFIVAIANGLAYAAIGWCCNTIGTTVTTRYRSEMLERMLYFDQDFFDRAENSSGALTSKLTSVPSALLELIAGNILLIFIVLVNLISSSVLAIVYGWKLGLVIIFGGLPLLVGSGFAKVRLDQKLERQTGDRFGESAGLATEAVTSIRTVASLTLEEEFSRQYAGMLDKIVDQSVRSLSVTMIGYALSQSLEFLVMALGFWYGSRLISTGEYTVTQFFVIFIAVVFGGQAAGQFFGYTTSITKAGVAANYILWLRTVKPDIAQTDENQSYGPSGDGPFAVENVEFRYKQRDASRVLRGVSMDIKPGSYVACVGPSGCGKTTVISLLERFYDVLAGRITLSGVNINSMNPRLYRNHMSLVQQEPTLYQGSIRENISIGLEYEPSEDELLEACRQANALEFVSSLPAGLNTPCGSKGLQFSGGQRQRLSIARALIRKPRLLLLDEATSALDTQSERIVQQTLDQAASSRTTVAVAHRLSTIRHADTIFVFANGRIAEQGTHEELQTLRGRYYEMCVAQSLDKA